MHDYQTVHAVVNSLDEVGTVPDETFGDILCGFTKCSKEDLKTAFQHLLTQEGIDCFSSCTLITAPFIDFSSSEPTIAKIKQILHDANNAYNIFQPPTNGLSIVMKVHTPTMMEIMVLIIVRNPITKPAFCRTRLSFMSKRIVDQVMIAVVENILVVTAIIKALETMKGTKLE